MAGTRVEALAARLEKGRQKTEEILEPLIPEQWQKLLYTDPQPWTARDLLAHFVSSEEALLRMSQNVAEGGPGAPEDFDFDSFNAEEQKRLADRSPQDLLTALNAARQRTLDWLRTLEDGQLDQIGRHPVLGMVSLEAMLTAIYGHQLIHMRELQRVLA
jgi:hypothetical protein